MNTPETDVIGGPYIVCEGGAECPIIGFKALSDGKCLQRYSKWLWSLSTDELERRKEIVKQQLDNEHSGSILDA